MTARVTDGREIKTKRGEMPREGKFREGGDSGSGHFDKVKEIMIKKIMTVCVPLCLKTPEDCHVHVPTDCWQEGKPMTGGGWPILVLRNKKPW